MDKVHMTYNGPAYPTQIPRRDRKVLRRVGSRKGEENIINDNAVDELNSIRR